MTRTFTRWDVADHLRTEEDARFYLETAFEEDLSDGRLICAALSDIARGRALDNVFCEHLWRSVKYENIHLNQFDTVRELQTGLSAYFDFYNHERPHQSLNYRTPAEEHFLL